MYTKNSPKILLIGCPWIVTKKSLDYLNAPVLIGLGYIAAILEKNNYNVKILDALTEGFSIREILKDTGLIKVGLTDEQISESVKEFNPDIVGISNQFTSQASTMFEVSDLVKKIDKKITVVVGGVHPSSDPLRCIKYKNIDFVITGEGEYAFLQLINSLNENKDFKNIKGLLYKINDRIYSNLPYLPIENLDEIPFPAYHLLPIVKSIEISKLDQSMRNTDKTGYLPVISSRGCPFSCIFCGANLLVSKKWRFRSPKNFVDEIEFLKNKYNISTFTFEDSNFTLDQERAQKICDEIIKRKLNIKWSLPNGIRADKVNDELISKIKEAGCHSVTLGIEHGNQEYLNKFINKALDLKNVERAVKIIKKYKISVSGFFMMGFPNETIDLIDDTISFAIKLARKGMMPLFSIVIPLPGTVLADYCTEKKLFIKNNLSPIDYLLSSHSHPTIKCENITPEQLIILRRKARILSAVNMAIFSPVEFLRYPFIKETLKQLLSPKTFINRFKLILTKTNIGT